MAINFHRVNPSAFPSALRRGTGALMVLLLTAVSLAAQETGAAPAGPPLGSFAAVRVAVLPTQLWKADTVGWSRGVTWLQLRAELDTAIAESLRERGLAGKWAFAGDVVRAARRNTLYASDPMAIGVGRWRSALPKPGDGLNALVADNLRLVTILGDTRHALIPVELRGEGDAGVLRLVMVDTRTRTVVWASDIAAPGGPALAAALAARLADLVVEP